MWIRKRGRTIVTLLLISALAVALLPSYPPARATLDQLTNPISGIPPPPPPQYPPGIPLAASTCGGVVFLVLTPNIQSPGNSVSIGGCAVSTGAGVCTISSPGSSSISGGTATCSEDAVGNLAGSFTVNPSAPSGVVLISVTDTGGGTVSAYLSIPTLVTSTSALTTTSTIILSSSGYTSTTTWGTSTSVSTSSAISTGLSSQTYTYYATTSWIGPTTTSITASTLVRYTFTVTNFIYTTISATITVITTVTGFVIRHIASNPVPDGLGLLGVLVLIAFMVFRRVRR